MVTWRGLPCPRPPAEPMSGSQPHGSSPRRPKAPALVRLKRNVSATFWLSYIVFAAAVGTGPSHAVKAATHARHSVPVLMSAATCVLLAPPQQGCILALCRRCFSAPSITACT